MIIILPIYYTIEYKRKPSKTILIGMNWFRNADFFLQNKVKQYYHNQIGKQIDIDPVNEFKLNIKVYIKNLNSDPSNIESLMIKFALDGFQEHGVIKGDTIKYHKGNITNYFIDKENPRCEIEIIKEN